MPVNKKFGENVIHVEAMMLHFCVKKLTTLI